MLPRTKTHLLVLGVAALMAVPVIAMVPHGPTALQQQSCASVFAHPEYDPLDDLADYTCTNKTWVPDPSPATSGYYACCGQIGSTTVIKNVHCAVQRSVPDQADILAGIRD